MELLAADGSSPFPVSLAGDRACGVQPVGVSRETGNTNSGEGTHPHLQVPRNCASSTKVGPLLSRVAVGLGSSPRPVAPVLVTPTQEARLSHTHWHHFEVREAL